MYYSIQRRMTAEADYCGKYCYYCWPVIEEHLVLKASGIDSDWLLLVVKAMVTSVLVIVGGIGDDGNCRKSIPLLKVLLPVLFYCYCVGGIGVKWWWRWPVFIILTVWYWRWYVICWNDGVHFGAALINDGIIIGDGICIYHSSISLTIV